MSTSRTVIYMSWLLSDGIINRYAVLHFNISNLFFIFVSSVNNINFYSYYKLDNMKFVINKLVHLSFQVILSNANIVSISQFFFITTIQTGQTNKQTNNNRVQADRQRYARSHNLLLSLSPSFVFALI